MISSLFFCALAVTCSSATDRVGYFQGIAPHDDLRIDAAGLLSKSDRRIVFPHFSLVEPVQKKGEVKLFSIHSTEFAPIHGHNMSYLVGVGLEVTPDDSLNSPAGEFSVTSGDTYTAPCGKSVEMNTGMEGKALAQSSVWFESGGVLAARIVTHHPEGEVHSDAWMCVGPSVEPGVSWKMILVPRVEQAKCGNNSLSLEFIEGPDPNEAAARLSSRYHVTKE